MGPTLKLLSLMKYTDPQGEEKTFHFVTECQNNCYDLGLELDISTATINGLKSSHRNLPDFCKAILQTWMDQDDVVTWARLLQALYNIHVDGIAKKLEEALNAHYQR